MECYLDNSATTRVCEEAAAACMHALTNVYGNPSSLHRLGYQAEQLLNTAREQLAGALFCDPGEICFTSGATEANNLALFGLAEANARRGKTILTTAVEHPSVLEPLRVLERRGFIVKRLAPGPNGNYSAKQFVEAIDDDTILISCMHVNNETGLTLPVEEIAQAVKRLDPQVLLHVDGVQSFLKLPFRLKRMGVDLMSISGHKVGAPKGVGALYLRKEVRLLPNTYGGGQQKGLRSGTEPVPLIAAFGAAAQAQKSKVADRLENYRKLKAELCAGAAAIPDVRLYTGEDYAPYIVNLAIPGIRSEVLLHFLEQKEIYVSSGSACSRGKGSHVLAALGFDWRTADEVIRVSFGPETTSEMIGILLTQLEEAARSLARRR